MNNTYNYTYIISEFSRIDLLKQILLNNTIHTIIIFILLKENSYRLNANFALVNLMNNAYNFSHIYSKVNLVIE